MGEYTVGDLNLASLVASGSSPVLKIVGNNY